VIPAAAQHVEPNDAVALADDLLAHGLPGTRWNQVRTSGPGSMGVLSMSRRAGIQPAVVHSRSKNFAELYQMPR
jgi:hypothetical protein